MLELCLWHTVADIAARDEDDGYQKPADPVVAFVGGLIGFVIAATIFWYVVSHR
jgi:hypothetical protein